MKVQLEKAKQTLVAMRHAMVQNTRLLGFACTMEVEGRHWPAVLVDAVSIDEVSMEELSMKTVSMQRGSGLREGDCREPWGQANANSLLQWIPACRSTS